MPLEMRAQYFLSGFPIVLSYRAEQRFVHVAICGPIRQLRASITSTIAPFILDFKTADAATKANPAGLLISATRALTADPLHVKICSRGCNPNQERADHAIYPHRGDKVKADSDSEGHTMWMCERERVRAIESSPMRTFEMKIVELLGLK